MTRETKIGLLVGLAFIIVIGILLSDHMATTTEPQQAALNTAQDNNRAATAVPNISGGGAVLPNNITPRDITPTGQVPTRGELTQARPIGDISVGGPVNPGAAGTTTSTTTTGSNTKANRDALVKANPQIADPNKVVIGQVYNVPTASIVPPPSAPAGQTGQRVLQLQTPPSTARDARSTTTTTTATVDSSITYTVKAGDNLYRIATDHVGNPQAVAAIKELNKDVLKGGDGIRVGMRLKLPAKPVASAN
jgi:LysM repeat protein